MEKKFLTNRSAITLVELITTVLLIVFIFAGGVIIVTTSMRLFKTELTRSIVMDDLTMALEWIKKDAMLSDEVDITTGNEITLYFTHPNTAPFPNIRYYVKGGTTELYRQISGVAGDGKLITDLIDAANLPIFTKPAESNYLLATLWIEDVAAKANACQDIGVMLRCRRTAP